MAPQTRGPLSRCSACKLCRYCSREHQSLDRANYRGICKNTKKGRAEFAKEEDALRKATTNAVTAATVFETDVGKFWDLEITRPYMQARFWLADGIRRTGTLDAITEALEHMQDMLRLDLWDSLGVRYIAPWLMLQLDRDQEAYDFLKWWHTQGVYEDGGFDPKTYTINQPVRNANPLESIDWIRHSLVTVQHLTAMLLLKSKLLVDIIRLKLSRKVTQDHVPPEIWSHIDQHLVRSDISQRWAGKSYGDLTAIQQRLENQIVTLIKDTQKIDKDMPFVLLNPDVYFSPEADFLANGPLEGTPSFLDQCYAAWWEHEKVLELFACAMMLSGVATDNMHYKYLPFNYGVTCRVNPCMLVHGKVIENTCGFIADAAEDAFSLSATRPSELRRQRKERTS